MPNGDFSCDSLRSVQHWWNGSDRGNGVGTAVLAQCCNDRGNGVGTAVLAQCCNSGKSAGYISLYFGVFAVRSTVGKTTEGTVTLMSLSLSLSLSLYIYIYIYIYIIVPSVLSCLANCRGRKSPGCYCAVTLFILLRCSIFCDKKS